MSDQGSETLHVLVGRSPRMQQVHRMIERLGRGRWPVLLLGETGTGKEVVARTIFNVNPAGPFVPIDCSSLVGPLMESELFGYVKGAFTGAQTSKIGLIEMAHNGTAFFDEIGELPLDLQAKLLRVLQEHEFRPVGAVVQRRSHFRVIAATNRDLAKEVEAGRFRADLYYRLNVTSLRLAPLRERKEDLPALIAHFLERYGNGHVIAQEALDAMTAYEWPGNIRELQNCIQHMVALNSGPLLHFGDLPSAVQNHHFARRAQGLAMAASAAAAPAAVAPPPLSSPSPVDDDPPPGVILPLVEVEKRAILQALRHTKGDRVAAAQLLGIGRTTLYRKLKEYSISEQQPLFHVPVRE
ncbi:MAG: sigma-54 interaction domain-containing protein [Bryobacteraceae bacterium]